MNAVGFLALDSSLQVLRQTGLTSTASPIAARISDITDYACERLSRVGAQLRTIREPNHGSGIVSFQLDGEDLSAVRDRCMANGIVLSHRNGCLRISPHAYNTETEIDQLVEVIAAKAS